MFYVHARGKNQMEKIKWTCGRFDASGLGGRFDASGFKSSNT
jgi:hypothetical protein